MKRQSNILLLPLSQQVITNLTTEVKETLATGHKETTGRSLTTVDLWNIQRRRKVRLQRRYF
jgi:hypothetical protein